MPTIGTTPIRVLSGADSPEPLGNQGHYGHQPGKTAQIFHIVGRVFPLGRTEAMARTERAVRRAAARCEVDVNQYMRAALMLRLQADGIRPEDLDEAA